MTALTLGGTGLRSHRSLFTGKERDTESGNDYFGARYYTKQHGPIPVTGLFSGFLFRQGRERSAL
jgi:hypothetical protein